MATAYAEPSRGRKIASALAMLGSAGIVAKESISHYSIEWLPLLFSGIMVAAGVGLTRRSMVGQVLSRGAAWIVLAPAALISGYSAMHGRSPGWEILGLLGGTAAALLLARPMLHTKEAYEQFAPKAFRRTFLAGSTASVATAYVTGGIGLEFLLSRAAVAPIFFAATFGALTLSLLASAVGVVRMRGWGILLGALTSFVLLLWAAIAHSGESFALALAAMPALVLHLLPILVARMRGPTTATRIASDVASESFTPTPTRYRVADDSTDFDSDSVDINLEPVAAKAIVPAFPPPSYRA